MPGMGTEIINQIASALTATMPFICLVVSPHGKSHSHVVTIKTTHFLNFCFYELKSTLLQQNPFP